MPTRVDVQFRSREIQGHGYREGLEVADLVGRDARTVTAMIRRWLD